MTDTTGNTNIPTDSIPLDVYNIIPGATFMLIDEPDPRVWVAQRVERDLNFEDIYVWAYDATSIDGPRDDSLSSRRAFSFSWASGYTVALIGLVVVPETGDDNNWGVSA